MQLSEDEIIKKKKRVVDFSYEMLYYHLDKYLLVFHVVKMFLKENKNTVIYKGKKFINRLKYV